MINRSEIYQPDFSITIWIWDYSNDDVKEDAEIRNCNASWDFRLISGNKAIRLNKFQIKEALKILDVQ